MHELHWKNAEGLRIHALHWDLDAPRAVLAVVHGQGEHIGRYFQLANWYTRQNIAVIGYDQQGHGRSEGRRGHAFSYEVLLDDIGLFLEKVRELYPETPVLLYGHSMGGNLSLNFILKREFPLLSGHIVTSPWIRLSWEPPAMREVAEKVIRQITPSLTLPTGLAVHFLTHDQQVLEMYRFDPYVHDKMSTAIGLALLEAASWLDRFEGAYPLPLLLMHGDEDRITSCDASRAFAERVGGPVRYREWPGMYHEIHNEIDHKQVFTYTLGWIDRVLEPTSK